MLTHVSTVTSFCSAGFN